MWFIDLFGLGQKSKNPRGAGFRVKTDQYKCWHKFVRTVK